MTTDRNAAPADRAVEAVEPTMVLVAPRGSSVFLVVREAGDHPVMACYNNRADADEDVALRHKGAAGRSHRYYVEVWHVGGEPRASAPAGDERLREALEAIINANPRSSRGWSTVRTELIEQARAALASPTAPPEPPPLDVERLESSIAEWWGPSYFPGKHDVTIFGDSVREVAEKIAAAYARLREQSP